jgi:hypothetical protein
MKVLKGVKTWQTAYFPTVSFPLDGRFPFSPRGEGAPAGAEEGKPFRMEKRFFNGTLSLFRPSGHLLPHVGEGTANDRANFTHGAFMRLPRTALKGGVSNQS